MANIAPFNFLINVGSVNCTFTEFTLLSQSQRVHKIMQATLKGTHGNANLRIKNLVTTWEEVVVDWHDGGFGPKYPKWTWAKHCPGLLQSLGKTNFP